ncbi:FeoB-associated Cys-rich membrane protein [Vibrio taketomensis]|nr:FeoB-associated Cys-rich membrane protein [Vibrio taketomensis]
MSNLIVALCIVSILGLAFYKVVAMKRKGGGCAGCSQASGCPSKAKKCN